MILEMRDCWALFQSMESMLPFQVWSLTRERITTGVPWVRTEALFSLT